MFIFLWAHLAIKCISEELMHVAAWYYGTPVPQLMKFGEYVCRFARPTLGHQICHQSIGRTLLFYRHSIVTLALDCFVSKIDLSLIVYRKCRDVIIIVHERNRKDRQNYYV